MRAACWRQGSGRGGGKGRSGGATGCVPRELWGRSGAPAQPPSAKAALRRWVLLFYLRCQAVGAFFAPTLVLPKAVSRQKVLPSSSAPPTLLKPGSESQGPSLGQASSQADGVHAP